MRKSLVAICCEPAFMGRKQAATGGSQRSPPFEFHRPTETARASAIFRM